MILSLHEKGVELLPIKVGSLNVTDSFWKTGRDEDDICRNFVVVLDFKDVSHDNVFPTAFNKLSSFKNKTRLIIDLSVLFKSFLDFGVRQLSKQSSS